MKHIYFSGIGGAAIGPLAKLAREAGFRVSGSDKFDSEFVRSLKQSGITDIHIGQDKNTIEEFNSRKPIDWLVYSSAVEKENPNHPELVFARENGIKLSKRDDLINEIINTSKQKMIAVAGTHGKTTTTAMLIWLFRELGVNSSHSIGGKISFAEVAEFNPNAKFFIYEADEYDRNFLSFRPQYSLITGIAYDHPDIYPTQENYNQAFQQFIGQSDFTILHREDADRLSLNESENIFLTNEKLVINQLIGEVNRQDARLVIDLGVKLGFDEDKCIEIMNSFPGVYRRFELLAPNIYTDYGHTPEKISGALQVAQEVNQNIVIVYEGLHNTRQHFIKEQLKHLFGAAKKIYIVPSYLAREDKSLKLLSPEDLCELIEQPANKIPSELNEELLSAIKSEAESGNLVICFSAGGANSLDEWLRSNL